MCSLGYYYEGKEDNLNPLRLQNMLNTDLQVTEQVL